MNISQLSKTENPLLSREEVSCEITGFKTTPNRAEVRGELASNLGVDEKLVVVTSIQQKFGEGRTVVNANVYANAESLAIEPAHLKKRHEPKGPLSLEKKEPPGSKETTSAGKKEEGEKPKAEAPKKEENK